MTRHDIRNSARSAGPPLRGHRYAFVCTALRWIKLTDDEELVVEANEDVDHRKATPGGTAHEEVQYKARSGTFGPGNKIVYEALGRFLQAWTAHTSAGHSFRGTLTTTMSMQDKRKTAIGRWVKGVPVSDTTLHGEVLPLLKRKGYEKETHAISSVSEFGRFREVVRWETGQPGLPEVTSSLREQVASIVPELDSELATEALIARVGRIAAEPDVKRRVLSRFSLWEFFSSTTVAGLSSNSSGSVHRKLIFGKAETDHHWATCGLIVREESAKLLGNYSYFWTKSPSSESVTRLGNKLEFACYLAISATSAAHARASVRKQARHIYPEIDTSNGSRSAREFANELARRSLEYAGGERDGLASMLTKVRWLRLPSGKVLTARNLLSGQTPSEK